MPKIGFSPSKDIQVIHGDCRDFLKSYSGEPFKFSFADPPFGIGQNYKGFNDKFGIGEYSKFTREWLDLNWLHTDGIVSIHGNDKLAEYYILWSYGLNIAPNRIAWINWHYRFGQCGRSNWIDSRCHCLIYAKKPDYTWNPEEVLVESDRVAYGDKRINETENGGMRLPFTVWGVPPDKGFSRVQGNNRERRPGHPNQLPEAYLTRLIKAYTNPGDLVLDPFAGSGTTAVVCKKLGRRCITIDISQENVESVLERLKQTQ